MNFRPILLMFAASIFCLTAQAQEQTDEELKRKLLEAGEENRTRGIVISPKANSGADRGVYLEDSQEVRPLFDSVAPAPSRIENASSVTIPSEVVTFEFNSYQLLPRSYEKLAQFGRVLQLTSLMNG